ncbi:protein regulator of cytokinesis 1 isoform X2 [Cherax quadricarinatus]|uniref:protein regulator of cytokinesis 1 isoform X2 n=1 Tax=Cherax quadricarinatus TaxID=27406 RepID=UPI00237974C3|nr:protein regulator of cytokinesis 1-like isoform X2 [Cherax quadricarinatus]
MADTSLRSTTKEELDGTLARLEAIWDDIGLTEDQREDRRRHFYGHIANLCDKIIDDEMALKIRITNNIDRNTRHILKLSEELCVESEESVDGLTLLELDAMMQERMEKLQQLKDERQETLKHLQEKDEGLCELLCETPYFIPSGLVPSREDLHAMEEHVKTMEKEKEEREKTFQKLKAGLLNFLEQLEQSPEDSFIQEVICSDDEDIPLGKAYLQQLRTVHSDLEFRVHENEAKSLELREKISNLWSLLQVSHDEQAAFLATAPKHTPSNIAKLKQELDKLLLLRLQNMSLFVEKLKEEVTVWWNKCYVDRKERERILAMSSGEANEDIMCVYEKEVEKWRKYYTKNSELLGMVASFLTLFENMLELEDRAKDPSRLFNTRGGALLLEEKAKKKVKAELPRVQERLIERVLAWEEREGRPFMIYGMQITQYMEELWESHDVKKEVEKNKRLQAKGVDVKRGTNLGTPHMRTPVSVLGSAKKRVRDGDDVGSVKKSKHLIVPGGVMFKSPSKSALLRSPIKTPRGKPLADCNPLVPLNPVTSTSIEASLHSTITYDKFEAGIGERRKGEIMHSSIVDEATPSSSYFPAIDQLREKRLRDTLHLASPIKGHCREKYLRFGQNIISSSSLRRVASQPCLTLKVSAANLRCTNQPTIPRCFSNKDHPLKFLM